MISEYCSITHLFTAENNKHLPLFNYIQIHHICSLHFICVIHVKGNLFRGILINKYRFLLGKKISYRITIANVQLFYADVYLTQSME